MKRLHGAQGGQPSALRRLCEGAAGAMILTAFVVLALVLTSNLT